MPVRRIDQDSTRFRDIVRGRIKRNLKRYVTAGEMIGKQGKKFVSIPLPQIKLPRFRYGPNPEGGVGQGEGDEGDPVQGEEGAGEAGEAPGQHVLEVDVALEDLAQILGEELELPNIEPRGNKAIRTAAPKYTGISRSGPKSLIHFKRTFRESLKRQVASGTYDPQNPILIPINDDFRYRSMERKE